MRSRASITIFAYGAFRPYGKLWHLIDGSVLDHWPARVYGQLFEHSSGLYPIADLSTYGTTIVGESMEVDLDGPILETLHMEVTSGYVPVWMDELSMEGWPTGRRVLAFEFERSRRPKEVGSRVPSGDWMPYAETQQTES